ncbi:MAG: (d)CMP kinase, partial [Mariprofundales bacterium]|nr:(d)CMP kinase [Mariprofundales bacterium]
MIERAIAGLQIAIDGPSGSGKGTIAKQVADRIGLPVLDTGLLYRFSAWRAFEDGVPLDDVDGLLAMLRIAVETMEWRAGGVVFFAGKDCTSSLRGEDVGAAASTVAAIPLLRAELLQLQRKLAQAGCVMDGRDIGSVVLPEAQAKFFLTASRRERARRRWQQLKDGPHEASLQEIDADLQARDARDAERDVA